LGGGGYAVTKDDFAEATGVCEDQPEEIQEEQPIAPLSEPPVPKTPLLHTVKNVLQPALEFLSPVRRFFKKDSVPNLILVMVLLTAVIGAGLGLVRDATAGRIAEVRSAATAEAMAKVFPGAGTELNFIQSTFSENVYIGWDENGRLIGFSVLVHLKGETGPVEMVVGVNNSNPFEVTGTEIVYHREQGDLSAIIAQGVGSALEELERSEQR
jgi:hypothetical protein